MAASKSDYYDILGVSKKASSEEIKKAYRKQALEWHPDRHRDNKEAAEKRFKEINEAYQILSDSQKRSAYDQYGHDAFAPGGGMGGAGAGFNPFGSGVKFTYSNKGGNWGSAFGGADFGDPFDIFEQFFGGASPFRAPRVPRYSLSLDFMEAVKGCQKEVSIGGKKRKIKIPAGVDEGSRINFGDFVLSVNVKPSTLFERDGADLYVRVGIPYSLAALGGEIEVPTIDKPIKIKVRAGTQPGTMIRLRGKGASVPGSRGSGDEYVRVSVLIPEKLTREQRIVVEEMETEGL